MARAPRPRTARLSRLILAGLCAVAAGCGGDDETPPDTDAGQIRAVAERLFESESVADQCERAVSPRFVRETYVTPAHCRVANSRDGDEGLPDTAAIAATRIDGDRATTGVILKSAKGARASGRIALVKAGGTWKVDRLGVGFLRSILAALPAEAASAHERLVLACLAQAARDLSDREVRRLGNRIVGQRLDPGSFPLAALQCIRTSAQPRNTV